MNFLRIIKNVCFAPSEFFRTVDMRRPLWKPFIFLFGLSIVSQLSQRLVSHLIIEMALESAWPRVRTPFLPGFSLVSLFVTPFVWAFGVSGTIQVLVHILSKGQGQFKRTFAVVTYGYGVMVVWIGLFITGYLLIRLIRDYNIVLPCLLIGSLLLIVWYCIVLIKGLAQVHAYGRSKAVLSVLIPGFLFIGAVVYLGWR